ncbi:NADH-quinone oxidoreductase subunit G [Candidatus Bealeia paramacronuclearis]|uniref:NADH-quinone oxidoreductase n=1 Tax=Candidatus Bealeia paramacronuclearis TaxID=1921001 RepID=A0ABZ2C7E1_9PROT|nr:NADH-quinone oxidoreductase subunit G [Candidatus Bealeia paramacronuclearis]
MPKLTINDQPVEVPEGMTVLQACQMAGVEVPVFCYHDRLSVAGNCRMCLVEMEKSPKPVASCAMPAGEGMVIRTNTESIQKARKGVLELLLINHPLDCPICDQGGECDLQDITMAYGPDSSRFHLNKRAVPDKNFGPLIETAMNRCIHCTRCVRFATEVAGVPELGAVYRGEHMEIGTYVEKSITSELSGNMIDLCPVGALTSKPYAFKGRPWELSHTPSIDVLDAVGSAIRIDSRGREVMRILPRLNEDVNEEWISDKARFACDGLKYQRLDRPYVKDASGRLQESTWEEAFNTIAERVRETDGSKIGALAGNLADAESMVLLKELMTSLGSPHVDAREEGSILESGHRCSYIFNTSISGIDQADFVLLIGTNPRVEAPIINARIRKNYLYNGLQVALIGEAHDLTYPYAHLGNHPQILEEILKGKHTLAKLLQDAKCPMLILGEGALSRKDGSAILHLAREIAEKYGLIHQGKGNPSDHWNGFNILHKAASRVGALDLCIVPEKDGYGTAQIIEKADQGKLEIVYLLGADEIDVGKLKKTFVIYQGHHGDKGASVADVILPASAYTEKDGTYVNTEGRVQRAFKACSAPGDAREDWKILRALSETLGLPLPYNTLEEIRARMVEINPLFEEVDVLQRAPWTSFGKSGILEDSSFKESIENFYMTDSISRHSVTMAECTRQILGRDQEKRTGTHG